MRWLAPALFVMLLSGSAAADEAEPWCAPELETLADDVCYHEQADEEGQPSTLVVFLHGLVKEGAGWQHNQMRGAVRGGKRLGFSVIAPRGRVGAHKSEGMVAWPTSAKAQETFEAALLAEWRKARTSIEARRGAPFEQIYVVGFSNGAYYASSLALRGTFAADGFAVFAGATSWRPASIAPPEERAPVFVGICSRDDTADDSRAFAALLGKLGFRHRSESRKVGHTVADAHLDNAIAFLRQPE